MSTTSTSPRYPDRVAAGRSISGWRAALIFFVVTIALTWPQAAHPLSVPPHDDAYFSMWRLAWIAHQLPRDPVHLFDGNTLYPASDTLAYSDAVLLQGVVGAPLIWLGAPVVLAYNLQILATFLLCGLGMFLLVRELTGVARRGSHCRPHLRVRALPVRSLRASRARICAVDAVGVVDAASNPAIGPPVRRRHDRRLRCPAGTLLRLPHRLLCHGDGGARALTVVLDADRAAPPRVAAAGAGALLAVAVLGLYMVPYRAARAIVGERGVGERVLYTAGPKHYIAAMPQSIIYGKLTGSIGLHEKRLFPGFAAMLLGAIALWPPLDRRRVAYAIALALTVDISFGHRGIVGALLQDHVAVYRGLRVVARIGAVVLLLLSVLAGWGVARVLARARSTSVTLASVAIAVIVVAEYLMWPMTLEPVQTRPAGVYQWLLTQPRGVVAEFPMPASWKKPWNELGLHESRFSYNSTFTWNPIVNGYSGFWPPSYITLIHDVRAFRQSAPSTPCVDRV